MGEGGRGREKREGQGSEKKEGGVRRGREKE